MCVWGTHACIEVRGQLLGVILYCPLFWYYALCEGRESGYYSELLEARGGLSGVWFPLPSCYRHPVYSRLGDT